MKNNSIEGDEGMTCNKGPQPGQDSCLNTYTAMVPQFYVNLWIIIVFGNNILVTKPAIYCAKQRKADIILSQFCSSRYRLPSNNSTPLYRIQQQRRCGASCIVQPSEHIQCGQAQLCACWRETTPSHLITFSISVCLTIFHLSSPSLWLYWRAIQQMFVDCAIQRVVSLYQRMLTVRSFSHSCMIHRKLMLCSWCMV